MSQIIKNLLICWVSLFVLFHASTASARVSAEEQILQSGFPVQPEALSKTTTSLLKNYEERKNIVSLIFYAYGLLRQATHFENGNDFIRASEYAKSGFFYLDEAADIYEDNSRVRYLRARIDAFLPAELGRCVIAMSDTDLLLKNKNNFDSIILAHIQYMHYRALLSCQRNEQAAAMLARMQVSGEHAKKLLSLNFEENPAWDYSEITQIIKPLMKDE